MLATATVREPRWFLGTTIQIHVSTGDGPDGLSVIESFAPQGDSPPLHVHETEDEIFHVLSGELRLRIDDGELCLREGETALAPRNVPHTYRVESADARWLVTTARGDLERFMLELSRPAGGPGLPPQVPPSPQDVDQLLAVAARHRIVIVGPPL